MINFNLNDEEKNLLRSLTNKKLIYYKHDSLEKFGEETVYGRVELFFDDDIIVLINYDYASYPLFGSKDDDHPKFSIRLIKEEEAVSALENTNQIKIYCKQIIRSIILVEDHSVVEWDEKKDEVKCLKAIIFKFDNNEIALQGDYMLPLIDIINGDNVKNKLDKPGDEFDNDPETKFISERCFINLNNN